MWLKHFEFNCCVNKKTRFTQTGFSLFELIVVVVVIGLLISFGLSKYFSPVEASQKSVLNFQANTFSRTIENIRALGVAKNTHAVPLDGGLVVYLNTFGWPVATSSTVSYPVAASLNVAHLEGCKSLWRDLFSGAVKPNPKTGLFGMEDFNVILRKQHVCRFELSRKQEGSFFFDYDIRTGHIEQFMP